MRVPAFSSDTGTRRTTVNDVLDWHVVLDIECLDRIYLNAYVPILQISCSAVTDASEAGVTISVTISW